MAVNKDKVIKQTEEAAQRSGRYRYLRKNATTNLRILEYTDADGDAVFAQQLVEHRKREQGGKGLGTCRMEVFGEPCAFCKVNEMARDKGKDAPFVSRTRYVINAVDIDNEPGNVRLWVIPTTVRNDVADYVVDDEWADVLEAKAGLAFGIKREGEKLDTEYTTKPQRKPFPVGKDILNQVVDPMGEIRDPGLQAQCATINCTVEDLFSGEELEKMVTAAPKAKSKKESRAKSRKPVEEPESGHTIKVGDLVTCDGVEGECEVTEILKKEGIVAVKDGDDGIWECDPSELTPIGPEIVNEPTMEIGAAVRYTDEEDVCHVSDVDGDAITIEDGNGDMYDCTMDDLTLVQPEEATKGQDEDHPKCFGDQNLYDAKDPECKACSYEAECSGNAELNKAGVGNNRTPSRKPKDRSADDIVADIIG